MTEETTHDPIRSAYQRVEQWLANNPPNNVLTLCDRAFIRSIQPRTPTIDNELRRLLDEIVKFSQRTHQPSVMTAIANEFTGTLIMLWLLKHHQRPAEALERLVVTWFADESFRKQIAKIPDPGRTAFHYWASKLSLLPAPLPSVAPSDPILRIYHHLHLFFYRTEYGTRPVPRAALADLHAKIQQDLQDPVFWRNPDIVGEALMAELAMNPANLAAAERLAHQLALLQQIDGGFKPEGTSNFNACHHGACVAAVALSRLIVLKQLQQMPPAANA